ncbi:MAG: PIN domain-containing protein [bacterium]
MSDKFSIAKVFFDSDALIAGSASRQGAAFILLQLSELGLIQGFISPKVVDECLKNLHDKLPDALPSFEQIVSHALTVLENPSGEETAEYSKMAHQKDLPILTAALRIKAHFLVTFNTKDFYPDSELGLIVLQPGDLIKRIRLRLSELSSE